MEKAAFKKKKTLFISKLDLHISVIAVHGAETWTPWKVHVKYLESFEAWCWRRMEKISWTDRLKNEEILRRIKEEMNILGTVIKEN
jgi:hypothetical protein